jgi:NAD dependent epimerase/dehydratase family enzyme
MRGPVNAVAGAVTNEEFTKVLGHVLGRPTILPVPTFALRLAFGEVADAVMLASTRVEPARLNEAGFDFKHTDIEGALRSVLGK